MLPESICILHEGKFLLKNKEFEKREFDLNKIYFAKNERMQFTLLDFLHVSPSLLLTDNKGFYFTV